MTPADLDAYLARREAVLAGVRDLVLQRMRSVCEPDEVDPDVSLFGTGLGLDSVDAVDLVVGLEDRFGIRLPDGAATHRALRTVGTVVDAVLAATGQARAAS